MYVSIRVLNEGLLFLRSIRPDNTNDKKYVTEVINFCLDLKDLEITQISIHVLVKHIFYGVFYVHCYVYVKL